MQTHKHSFTVDATPQEIWSVWWGGIRRHRSAQPQVLRLGTVTIEILHPGDAVHDGLVRHCTYAVPRYLLSNGIAHSWELVTAVIPEKSSRYQAITRPPFATATGIQQLESLTDGRTLVTFTESYSVAHPLLRLLFERRTHRFISDVNDRLMEDGIRMGLSALRGGGGQQRPA